DIRDVSSNNNISGNGVYIGAYASDEMIMNIENFIGNENNNSGLFIEPDADELLRITMNNITTNDNLVNGIFVENWWLFGDFLLDISNIVAHRNDSIGVEFYLSTDGSGLATFNNLTCNMNYFAGAGIQLYAWGPEGLTMNLNGITALNNGGCGIHSSASASEDVFTTINNIIVNDNDVLGPSGVGLEFESWSDFGDSITQVTNVEANRNYNGLWLMASSGKDNGFIELEVKHIITNENTNNGIFDMRVLASGDGGIASLKMEDVVANKNGGYGIYIWGVNADWSNGSSVVNMNDLVAHQNDGGGLYLKSTAINEVTINLNNASFNENTGNGLYLRPRSLNSGVLVNVSEIIAKNNTSNGVFAFIQANAGSSEIDFGGGNLGSPGQNKFYGNSVYQFADLSLDPYTITVENSFWSADPPIQGTTYPAPNGDYYSRNGVIDVDPYLTTDPHE
ncbi:hypothetical protein ACFL1T_05115, partial [Chlamydiota bacterium]